MGKYGFGGILLVRRKCERVFIKAKVLSVMASPQDSRVKAPDNDRQPEPVEHDSALRT